MSDLATIKPILAAAVRDYDAAKVSLDALGVAVEAIRPLLAAEEPPEPTPPAPAPPAKPVTQVTTQEQFDALGYVVRPGTAVHLGPGVYMMSKQLRVDGELAGYGQPTLQWVGAVKAGTTSMIRLGHDATVTGLHFDPKGAVCIDCRGDRTRIAYNTADAGTRDFVKVYGCDAVTIEHNKVPSAFGYFAYVAGFEGRSSRHVRIVGNTCLRSEDSHIVRFHDTYGVTMTQNHFARPKSTCVIKGHDGGDWDIFGNRLEGGVVALYPLGGRDGGMAKPEGPVRDEMLAKLLLNVRFHHNTCDDVVIHTGPGARDLSIYENTLSNVRDVAFQYRATENGYDYRPFRGEPTGVIRANRVTKAEGNTKPLENMPASVTVEW